MHTRSTVMHVQNFLAQFLKPILLSMVIRPLMQALTKTVHSDAPETSTQTKLLVAREVEVALRHEQLLSLGALVNGSESTLEEEMQRFHSMANAFRWLHATAAMATGNRGKNRANVNDRAGNRRVQRRRVVDPRAVTLKKMGNEGNSLQQVTQRPVARNGDFNAGISFMR